MREEEKREEQSSTNSVGLFPDGPVMLTCIFYAI